MKYYFLLLWLISAHALATPLDINDQDADFDGVSNGTDNCPEVFNRNQIDLDGDGIGAACDPGDRGALLEPPAADYDGDGLTDDVDPCLGMKAVVPPDDRDGNGIVDACDPFVTFPDPSGDEDADGVSNSDDICWFFYNPDQINVCKLNNLAQYNFTVDPDLDHVESMFDTCPNHYNPGRYQQLGICNPDVDFDGVRNANDNCPVLANDQSDVDLDGIGDACDEINDYQFAAMRALEAELNAIRTFHFTRHYYRQILMRIFDLTKQAVTDGKLRRARRMLDRMRFFTRARYIKNAPVRVALRTRIAVARRAL